MSKQRIEGRLRGNSYLILAPDGGVLREYPLGAAREDQKLKAAIARNSWEPLDGRQ